MKIKLFFIFLTSLIIITLSITTTISLDLRPKKDEARPFMPPPTDQAQANPESVAPRVETYQVPVLMYHYIRNADERDRLGQSLSVTPENFDLQINWLKQDNYASIKLSDLADPERKALSKIYFENKKPIVITFDDGYDNAFTMAYPILKNYGFYGTFFIVRDFIGKPNYLDQEQINQLINEGMEIGSHTLAHHDLTKLGSDDLRREIFDSKGDTFVFAYPLGKFNDATMTAVKEAGYLAAVTTNFGIANQNSDLFTLPRVRAENGDGIRLKEKIEAAYQQSR